MSRFNHRIGWMCVAMTPAQITRWNSAGATDQDLADILVAIPTSDRGLPTTRVITLAQAAEEYPEAREVLDEGWACEPI